MTGVHPGRRAVWARASDSTLWRQRVEIRRESPSSVEIHLQRGAKIAGSVMDMLGAPVPGARIRTFHEAIEPRPNTAWQGPSWALVHGSTDSEGHYELPNLMPGRVKVRVEQGDRVATATFELRNEQRVTWNAVVGSGLSIRGLLVGPRGRPLEGWRIHAEGGKTVAPLRQAHTDAQGRFELERAEDVAYRLLVATDAAENNGWTLQLDNVRPGPEMRRIEVPEDRFPTARLGGRVLGPNGTPLAKLRLEFRRLAENGTSEGAGRKVDLDDGQFTTKPLRPGRYWANVSSELHGKLALGEWTLSPHETLDIGTHRYPQRGCLDVEVMGADGKRLRHVRLTLRREGAPMGYLPRMKDGVGRWQLQPGRYVLSTWGYRVTMTSLWAEVLTGRTTKLRFDVAEGVSRRFRIGPFPANWYLLRETWRNASGRLVFEGGGSWDRSEKPSEFTRAILPGRYTVTMRDGSGATSTARFVVDELPGWDKVFELPLPGAQQSR